MSKKTLDEVLTAIKGSGGVKYVVAQRLGIARTTLDSYLAKWQTAQAALEAEDESTGDMAEAVIKRNIELAIAEQSEKKVAVDSGDAWRWLRTRRKDRFAERHEISGPDGETLEINVKVTDAGDED